MKNKKLQEWVDSIENMCQPDQVYWCNGSKDEFDRLMGEAVDSGKAIALNPEKRPGCYLFRSHPSDVARVEDRTFYRIRKARGCRTDEQLDRPRCAKRNNDAIIHRVHEGKNHVCHSFLHGSDRFADFQDWR